MGVLYESSLVGGKVAMGGWSPPKDGSGTGSFTMLTTGALFIYQAYLIAGRVGIPTAPLTVQLNNGFNTQSLTFSNSTRVSQEFFTAYQNNSGLSSVHAIDVTSIISTQATNYTLTVPPQNNATQRYPDFSLVIIYQVASLSYTDVQIFINENNFGVNNSRVLNFVNNIDNSKPVAMGFSTGYCCNTAVSGNGQHDATQTYVNVTNLGIIGATTSISGDCTGSGFVNPVANFSYSNGVLTAGTNCNTNQAMGVLDVLSNIQGVIAPNTTTYTAGFDCVEATNITNYLWAIVTAFAHTNLDYEADLCGGGTPMISNITSSGATITWCPQYITPWTNVIQWRTWQTVPWVQFSSNQVNTNSYNITGLISNTAYEVRIVNIDANGALLRPSPITRFITA